MKVIHPNLKEYIQANQIKKKLSFYLILSESNRILDVCNVAYKLELNSSKGDSILNTAPYLLGYFPLESEKLILPAIETSTGQIFDIHLFRHTNEIYVLYFDALEDVLILQKKVQQYNENILKNYMEKDGESKFDQNLLSLILASIRIVSFERKESGKFKIIGHLPDWFSEIFTPDEIEKSNFELEKKFLFIELFLEEAKKIWANKNTNLISSDLWTELSMQGKEFYLQAFALSIEERDILFIKMIDCSGENEIDLLQKARQKNLDYENLLKTERELERVLKFKDQFVSIISHDLRSPVAAISGFTDLLLTDEDFLKKLNIEQKEILSFIHLSVNRLLDYTKKIYHWSNLELGKFKLSKQKIGMYYCCKEVESTFIMDLKKKNIKLDIDVPSSLEIVADETLLNQAINNLVGNAIKFTHENGLITIRSVTDSSGITLLSIKDNGVGINAESQKKLFSEHFEQHTVGTSGEIGSGLGLSIVKRILDAHNFKIEVKSEVNVGTEFTIIIS